MRRNVDELSAAEVGGIQNLLSFALPVLYDKNSLLGGTDHSRLRIPQQCQRVVFSCGRKLERFCFGKGRGDRESCGTLMYDGRSSAVVIQETAGKGRYGHGADSPRTDVSINRQAIA